MRVLLWSAPAMAQALHTYKDRVLPLLAEHGGQVIAGTDIFALTQE